MQTQNPHYDFNLFGLFESINNSWTLSLINYV